MSRTAPVCGFIKIKFKKIVKFKRKLKKKRNDCLLFPNLQLKKILKNDEYFETKFSATVHNWGIFNKLFF